MVVCMVSTEGKKGSRGGSRTAGYRGCGSWVVVSILHLERGVGCLRFGTIEEGVIGGLELLFARHTREGFVSHCRKQGMNMHPTLPPIPKSGGHGNDQARWGFVPGDPTILLAGWGLGKERKG